MFLALCQRTKSHITKFIITLQNQSDSFVMKFKIFTVKIIEHSDEIQIP